MTMASGKWQVESGNNNNSNSGEADSQKNDDKQKNLQIDTTLARKARKKEKEFQIDKRSYVMVRIPFCIHAHNSCSSTHSLTHTHIHRELSKIFVLISFENYSSFCIDFHEFRHTSNN